MYLQEAIPLKELFSFVKAGANDISVEDSILKGFRTRSWSNC